jgi:hypothetical protein
MDGYLRSWTTGIHMAVIYSSLAFCFIAHTARQRQNSQDPIHQPENIKPTPINQFSSRPNPIRQTLGSKHYLILNTNSHNTTALRIPRRHLKRKDASRTPHAECITVLVLVCFAGKTEDEVAHTDQMPA